MGLLGRVFGKQSRDIWRTETALMRRIGYVLPPVAVQWISTSTCDLSCPHCYSQAGKKSHGELTTDEARRWVIEPMVEMNRPLLVIAGGETLLRKDFPEVIDYCRERRLPWAIHTHGGRVEQHADVFRKYPPSMAAISVDGPAAEHDAFRGKVGSHAAAMRAIRLLKQIGVSEVVAGTTINRRNADLLFDMVDDVMESGADSWGFHLMTPEGRAGEHLDLLPTDRQLRRAAGLGRRLRGVFHVELDNEWGGAGRDDCFYRDEPFSCGAGRISCVISAVGEVMPCTTTDLRESAGNVRERSLIDIWADGFRAFRTPGPGIAADCDDCWLQTRHGHSCRSAFALDIWEHAGRRRVPLMQIGTSWGTAP